MDQRVSKKVLHAGRGALPEFADGDRLRLHLRSEPADGDGPVLDDSRKHRPIELILGKQFKLEVLEASVRTMAVGEVAEFAVDKSLLHTYPLVMKTLRDTWQPEKRQPAPAHSCCGMAAAAPPSTGYPDLDELLQKPRHLRLTVELLTVESRGEYEPESWALTEEERLRSVTALRQRGNTEYAAGRHAEAAAAYTEALTRLEPLMLREKPHCEEWLQLQQLQLPLLLNLAQCQLLLTDYYPAIEHCCTVLAARPDDVKALYRRGRAHAHLCNMEDARADLQRAAELDPSLAAAVRRLLHKLDTEQRQHDERDRSKLCGKMF